MPGVTENRTPTERRVDSGNTRTGAIEAEEDRGRSRQVALAASRFPPCDAVACSRVQSEMHRSVAIVGAGVSGLTCAVVFAEHGYAPTVFARDFGQRTTSGVAAAIWFPYDAEPAGQVAAWSLETFAVLRELRREPASGVDLVELRVFARRGVLEIPDWARSLGAAPLDPTEIAADIFTSGYAVEVPVTDTTIYLDYLSRRAADAGATFTETEIASFDDIDCSFDLIINCSGTGANVLARDDKIEPHRGQVAVVAQLSLPYAVVCDDPPLMYAIPRRHDCILGGTNDVSDNPDPTPEESARIVAEAARVLGIETLPVITDRVGLRPFRRSGIRLEMEQLAGRAVIHNYGHGGSGFTLSWGCASAVLTLQETLRAGT